jgi:hypothetical protein
MIDPVTSVAPPGKLCTRCLCCLAIIAFDGEFLCAACDDGTHPRLFKQRPTPPIALPPPQLRPILPPAPTPAKEPSMTFHKEDVTKRRTIIDETVKAAILAADPSISNGALARKHGISDYFVANIRREAGIKSTAKPGSSPTPLQIAASLTTNAKATSGRTGKEVKGWIAEPDTKLPRSAAVTLNLGEETLNAWWINQTLERKAIIFGQFFEIRVEGIVG